jgi:hypothetical protein
MEEIFHAVRTKTGCRVTVKGKPIAKRLSWRNHSTTGFEWGFQGSGPAQLALAMLAHVFDKQFALEHYQCFKREKIAMIEGDEWYMEFDEMREWRKGHLACVFRNGQTTQLLFDQATQNGKGKQ